jgi:ABC-type lipopolysaccharide export system ATPase subunit
LLETVFNPRMSSHGHSGEGLTRLPLNALTSKQKDNCNASPLIMEEVLSVIRQLRNQGITIVLVEQNVHNALSVADRAYVLTTGRIVAEDTAAGLLQNPDVLRTYLGG